jgi:hypothetical protein
MSFAELGEAFLWFCLALAIALAGAFLAILGIVLNRIRGTKGGRTPLVCAFLSGVASLFIWLIVAYADPPASLLVAFVSTIITIWAFVSWLNRSDRS